MICIFPLELEVFRMMQCNKPPVVNLKVNFMRQSSTWGSGLGGEFCTFLPFQMSMQLFLLTLTALTTILHPALWPLSPTHTQWRVLNERDYWLNSVLPETVACTNHFQTPRQYLFFAVNDNQAVWTFMMLDIIIYIFQIIQSFYI